MGAIQSSINQALSVGAFLASQSPQLQQRAAKHAALKDIETRRGVLKEKASDIMGGSMEERNLIKDMLKAQEAGDTELVEKLRADLDVASRATGKELELLTSEAEGLVKEQFEIDPGNPELHKRYKEIFKNEAKADIEQEKAAEAEAAQKAERAKKDKRNERDRINRAVERALRKREAQEALATRRQEMGDAIYIGGQKLSSNHPIYQRVQEQLQKEGQ